MGFFPSWLLLWVRPILEQRDADTPPFSAQSYISSGQRSHPAVSWRITPFPWICRNLALPIPCSSEQHLGLVTSSSDELQLIFHLLPPSPEIPACHTHWRMQPPHVLFIFCPLLLTKHLQHISLGPDQWGFLRPDTFSPLG